MNVNQLEYIHANLSTYKSDFINSHITTAIKERGLSIIFDIVNTALIDDLNLNSIVDSSKKLFVLRKIEADVENLYLGLQQSRPKVRILKKISNLFTGRLLTTFRQRAALKRSHDTLIQNLIALENQLILQEDLELENELANQASTLNNYLTDPIKASSLNVPPSIVRKTLKAFLVNFDLFVTKFSKEEALKKINNFPHICNLIPTNSISLSNMIKALENQKSIRSFLENSSNKSKSVLEAEHQLLVLLAEELPTKEIIFEGEADLAVHSDRWKVTLTADQFIQVKVDSLLTNECRGIELNFKGMEAPTGEWWNKLLEVAESDLRFISLSFEKTLSLKIPPQNMSKEIFERLLHVWNKIEIRSPVSIELKLTDEASLKQSEKILENLHDIVHLDLANQPIYLIRSLAKFFGHVNSLDLSNTQITDRDMWNWQQTGKLVNAEKIILSGCTRLTTDFLFPFASIFQHRLKSVMLPNLPVGKNPLPASKDPRVIQELFGHMPNLQQVALAHYKGSIESAVALQEFFAGKGIQEAQYLYSSEKKTLSPEVAVQWLDNFRYQHMPPNPYITTLDLGGVKEVNDDNLLDFLEKFPNIELVSLEGCSQITENAFKKPKVEEILSKIRLINLLETQVLTGNDSFLRLQFPLLNIVDFWISVNDRKFPFDRKELKSLTTPFWKEEFLEGGKLFNKSKVAFESDANRAIFLDTFREFSRYVHSSNPEKKYFKFKDPSFNQARAEEYLSYSRAFGEDFIQKIWEALIDQVCETTNLADLSWMKQLAKDKRNTEAQEIFRSAGANLGKEIKKKTQAVDVSPKLVKVEQGQDFSFIIQNQMGKEKIVWVSSDLLKNEPFFDMLLRTEQEGLKRNQLIINDENPDAVAAIFPWITSREIFLNKELLPELIRVADKYQVVSLIHECLVFEVNEFLNNFTDSSTLSKDDKRKLEDLHRLALMYQFTDIIELIETKLYRWYNNASDIVGAYRNPQPVWLSIFELAAKMNSPAKNKILARYLKENYREINKLKKASLKKYCQFFSELTLRSVDLMKPSRIKRLQLLFPHLKKLILDIPIGSYSSSSLTGPIKEFSQLEELHFYWNFASSPGNVSADFSHPTLQHLKIVCNRSFKAPPYAFLVSRFPNLKILEIGGSGDFKKNALSGNIPGFYRDIDQHSKFSLNAFVASIQETENSFQKLEKVIIGQVPADDLKNSSSNKNEAIQDLIALIEKHPSLNNIEIKMRSSECSDLVAALNRKFKERFVKISFLS